MTVEQFITAACALKVIFYVWLFIRKYDDDGAH